MLPPPVPVLYLPLVCVGLGYVLNMVWMVMVVGAARKTLQGRHGAGKRT